ncbi:MAG: hypothetical protein JSS74_06925 [Actinobacteria bacterium]|nr:hypothetical protein [Actinomycetota bacterium]
MVERNESSRYVSDSAGAPPLPPPGGYRGARRELLGTPAPSPVIEQAQRDGMRLSGDGAPPKKSALGWIAISAAFGFAIVLTVLFGMGAADAFLSPTMLVLQLAVLGVAIAALVTRAGRVLGAVALTIALVLNIATVGALSTVRVAATGSYGSGKTPTQKLWEAYPGVKDHDPQQALGQQSLEKLQALADDTMADVRAQLTAQYGLQWVKVSDVQRRPERNGYGGESMLERFTSEVWATTTPVTGYEHKLAVMKTVQSVIVQHGWNRMIAFNDPSSGMDPATIAKMYGGATPTTQVDWEWFSDERPEPGWFYADITDLANDVTGEYRTAREQTAQRTGEPVEGLRLTVVGRYMLSESKAAEFQRALTKYP